MYQHSSHDGIWRHEILTLARKATSSRRNTHGNKIRHLEVTAAARFAGRQVAKLARMILFMPQSESVYKILPKAPNNNSSTMPKFGQVLPRDGGGWLLCLVERSRSRFWGVLFGRVREIAARKRCTFRPRGINQQARSSSNRPVGNGQKRH